MPYKANFYLINKVLQAQVRSTANRGAVQDTKTIKLIERFEYIDKLEVIDRMDYHFINTDKCINSSNLYKNPLTENEDD